MQTIHLAIAISSMWLIDTSSLKLEAFLECPVKSYAILSHTWNTTAEEPTFQEFSNGKAQVKAGFEKIRLCCEQAKSQGIQWAWVDTCCINKESSTELSEAINSMFRWYQQAKICYVYLADVSHTDDLRRSRWFSRGWTLQELIAPESVTFFTQKWDKIGNKADLASTLSSITGIDMGVLMMSKGFSDCSVAQRMSWASNRQTTRLEDSAYCLIGIFNANLSLQYGEGTKAFLRLQEYIIEQTNDETIFAWDGVEASGSGLLAPSAAHFSKSGNIERGNGYRERPHYFRTNKGLSIECRMLPCEMNTYVVPLQCCANGKDPTTTQLAVFIGRTTKDDQYRRVLHNGKSLDQARKWNINNTVTRHIFVPTDGKGLEMAPNNGQPLLRITSNFETWLLDRSRKQTPVGLQNVVEPSLLSPRWKTSDTDGVEMHNQQNGNLPDIENPQADHALPTLVQFQFREQDLARGILIAIKCDSFLNPDFVGYVHIGFDADFQPACGFYRSKFRLEAKKSDRLTRFFSDYRSPRMIDSLWTTGRWCDTFTIYPMPRTWISHDGRHQVDPNDGYSHQTGDRFEGLVRGPFPFYMRFAGCMSLEVSFRPVEGLTWKLELRERRDHVVGWMGGKYVCLKCVARRLDRVKSELVAGCLVLILLAAILVCLTILICLSLGRSVKDGAFKPVLGLTAIMILCSGVPHLFMWSWVRKEVNRLYEVKATGR